MNINNATFSDKLIFPKKPNDEYVKEYCFSKAAKKYIDMAQRNSGDSVEWNVDLMNYLTKRQLDKTDKKLGNTRKLYKTQRKSFNEQWNDLESKEDQLRKQFIEFNSFIIENNEKRRRAASKIIEQNLSKANRQKTIEELNCQLNEINMIKTRMDKNISKYRIYEQYLLNFVEYEPSIDSINDIVKRYQTLAEARNKLDLVQQRNVISLENTKISLRQMIENYSQKMSEMKNKVNDLEKKYDAAILNCRKWEKMYHYIKAEAADNLINTIAIKESCNQIYNEICHRKGKQPSHLNSTEKQLLIIKQAIAEYEIINRKIKEQKELDLIASNRPKLSSS